MSDYDLLVELKMLTGMKRKNESVVLVQFICVNTLHYKEMTFLL